MRRQCNGKGSVAQDDARQGPRSCGIPRYLQVSISELAHRQLREMRRIEAKMEIAKARVLRLRLITERAVLRQSRLRLQHGLLHSNFAKPCADKDKSGRAEERKTGPLNLQLQLPAGARPPRLFGGLIAGSSFGVSALSGRV